MKRKIYFPVILLYIAINANSQFVPVDINYQDSPYDNYPEFISIVDESNVWLGTRRSDATTQVQYTYAVHTNDGGNSWELDSIPVAWIPDCQQFVCGGCQHLFLCVY